MKKLLASAAFVAMAMAAGSAFADDTVSSEVTLEGTSVPTCEVIANGTTNTIGGNWTISGLISGQDVDTTAVVDADIGTVRCNYAANAGLQTTYGSMTSGLTAVSGFENNVEYTAVLGWGGMAPLTLNAQGVAGFKAGAADAGPRSGTVSLTITPTANTDPLLAGDYSDTLVVQIGDAL